MKYLNQGQIKWRRARTTSMSPGPSNPIYGTVGNWKFSIAPLAGRRVRLSARRRDRDVVTEEFEDQWQAQQWAEGLLLQETKEIQGALTRLYRVKAALEGRLTEVNADIQSAETALAERGEELPADEPEDDDYDDDDEED